MLNARLSPLERGRRSNDPSVVSGYCFRFLAGSYEGGEFPLDADVELTIGREPTAGMAIMETGVSRNHARISTKNGKVTLIDLGATNGTFVNGERLAGQRELKVGDKVVIGQSLFKLAVRGS